MTPLVLVVGFLGSGKTTFLKSLMPAVAERGLRPGLLINDYQNARVDAEQFRDLIDEVRALSGDCVCCGSREQLFEELQGFVHGPGRVMVVETNGTTDAAALVEALALDPALRKFTDPIQVSVIDAQRWQKRFWHNRLEREQAVTASHVVMTRRDVVSAQRWDDVLESLEKHGVRGRETGVAAFADELAVICDEVAGIDERELSGGCGCHGHHDHEHHTHAHDHGQSHFASCELALPASVSREALAGFLKNLPSEVVRAKGLVRFDEAPGEFFVFQRIDDDVQFFPVGPNPRLATPLVLLIGPSLDVDALSELASGLFAGNVLPAR